jgi:hypothetical protein
MEACTVETGLLRKAPCGQTAVARCANCEQPLCSKHAIAQLNAAGKKTGTFLCADCDKARRDHEKYAAASRSAPAMRPPGASAPKPANPASKPPPREEREHSGEIAFTSGTKVPAPPKPAAAAPMPRKPEPPREDSGVIEYSPAKKPGDKK